MVLVTRHKRSRKDEQQTIDNLPFTSENQKEILQKKTRISRLMGELSRKFWFFLALCPAALVSIACIFLYSNLERGRLSITSKYNKSVQFWDNSEDASFFMDGVWAAVGDNRVNLTLSRDFVDNPSLPMTQTNKKLLRLQSLPSTPLYEPFIWPDDTQQVIRNLELLYNETVLFSLQFPVAYEVDLITEQSCPDEECETQQVTQFAVLRDLCFVAQDKKPAPYVSSRRGCGVDGDNITRGELQGYQKSDERPSLCLEGFNLLVSVRSNLDPWVIAAQITDGTFFFGISVQEHHYLMFALLAFSFTLIQAVLMLWFCGGPLSPYKISTPTSVFSTRQDYARLKNPRLRESSVYSDASSCSQSSQFATDNQGHRQGTAQAYYKSRLKDFYQAHDPSRVDSIDFLLIEYRGREMELIRKLEQKTASDLPHIEEHSEASFDFPRGAIFSFDESGDGQPQRASRKFMPKNFKRDSFTETSSRTSRMKSSPSQRGHRSFAYTRLKNLFERFNREGIDTIDYLLDQYKGREMKLVEKYEHRYIRMRSGTGFPTSGEPNDHFASSYTRPRYDSCVVTVAPLAGNPTNLGMKRRSFHEEKELSSSPKPTLSPVPSGREYTEPLPDPSIPESSSTQNPFATDIRIASRRIEEA